MEDRRSPKLTRTIDAASFAAHQAWMKRGARGEGQLVLEDRSLAEEIYGKVDLSFTSFARCELAHTDFSGAIFDEANLQDVSFVCAVLAGASLDHAFVKGGSFVRADLRRATLREIRVSDTDLSRADLRGALLVGSSFANAHFDGSVLADAVIDGATFMSSSFRDASFGEVSPRETPSVGARFVDCDFTGADWAGRNLRKTTFVRCKVAGVRGVPAMLDDDAFEDCDVVADDFAPRTLTRLIADVIALHDVQRGPSPGELRAKLARRGRRVTVAAQEPSIPPWALGASRSTDIFVELEPEHECEGVRIADEPATDSTLLEISLRDLPLAKVEEATGKLRETPRVPGGPRRMYASKTLVGRNIAFHASVRDDRVFALTLSLPRAGVTPMRPDPPLELTPDTTVVASLEQGGERFEARCYKQDGVIDVVRYAADGTILEKRTFTWSSEYMLWDAKLAHVEGDRFVLEISGEHWKGATPFEEKFDFTRSYGR